MLVCEGTVISVVESEPKVIPSTGETFTTWTVQVYGGGDYPHYLELMRNFDRSSLPAAGEPIRAAVSIRPYPSTSARSGAGASLILRALLPAIPVAATA